MLYKIFTMKIVPVLLQDQILITGEYALDRNFDTQDKYTPVIYTTETLIQTNQPYAYSKQVVADPRKAFLDLIANLLQKKSQCFVEQLAAINESIRTIPEISSYHVQGLKVENNQEALINADRGLEYVNQGRQVIEQFLINFKSFFAQFDVDFFSREIKKEIFQLLSNPAVIPQNLQALLTRHSLNTEIALLLQVDTQQLLSAPPSAPARQITTPQIKTTADLIAVLSRDYAEFIPTLSADTLRSFQEKKIDEFIEFILFAAQLKKECESLQPKKEKSSKHSAEKIKKIVDDWLSLISQKQQESHSRSALPQLQQLPTQRDSQQQSQQRQFNSYKSM